MKLNLNLLKKLNIDLSKAPLVICVVCMLLSLYAIYVAKTTSAIYTVGVNRLTESFSQHLDKSSLNPKQRADYMLGFAENLEKSLSVFSKKGMTVLMEESVISGGQDITEQVAKEIQKALKK